MIHDAQLRRYRDWGWTFLSPAAYSTEVGEAKRALWVERPGAYEDPNDPLKLEREARNRLLSRKITEMPDHGRFADLRELVALRLAPWLRP